jgi:hypothetical protein
VRGKVKRGLKKVRKDKWKKRKFFYFKRKPKAFKLIRPIISFKTNQRQKEPWDLGLA